MAGPSPAAPAGAAGKDELLREMDAAGVTGAVIVPSSWGGERNDLALGGLRILIALP